MKKGLGQYILCHRENKIPNDIKNQNQVLVSNFKKRIVKSKKNVFDLFLTVYESWMHNYDLETKV